MANGDTNDNSDQSVTITLSPRDVRAAQRLIKMLAAADGDLDGELLANAAPAERVDAEARGPLVERARQAIQDRRRRAKIFGRSMAEAAWDMLLALYITDSTLGRTTIGRLTSHSGLPATTAQRWLDYLVNRRLVTREPHPNDRRVVFVRLSDTGRSSLDMYFSGTVGA